MQDDDVYINDGSNYFLPREPQEQQIDRKREQAQATEQEAILQDLIDRWDERINFYESVKAIPDEVKLDPEAFMKIVTVNSEIVDILKAEKEYIESIKR